MSSSNTHQNHPLIPSAQTYFLDRKIISFHSCDRDYKKWPHANHFEITLPESLLNVQSMRLVTISLPSNQYIFSNEYQNTKLSFTVDNQPQIFTITIHEGAYTSEELAIEISTQMNSAVSGLYPLINFVCKYNKVSNTFWFGTNPKPVVPPVEGIPFTLLFGKKETYTDLCPGQVCVWGHYTRWGLPAYLGYQKHSYAATAAPSPFGFSYETPKIWITKGYYVNVYDLSGGRLKICNLDILGEDTIYMELERYNTLNEIEPYAENTAGWYNNDYNGKVNSAFAKIPIICTPYAQTFNSKMAFLMNTSYYQPPIERLIKCRFKFRYHDGRLVDFKCLPLNFSIEFNMLKPEQFRGAMVRVPPMPTLLPPLWKITR